MKILICTLTALLISIPGHSCSIKSEFGSSLAFTQGVLNRLSEMKIDKELQIVSIEKNRALYLYEVKLANSDFSACKRIKLRPYGPGDCNFTADVEAIEDVKCDDPLKRLQK